MDHPRKLSYSKTNLCFQTAHFRVNKSKLTNRRKLSKMLVSGTLRTSARDLGHPAGLKLFPGNRGLINGQEPKELGYSGPSGNPNVQIPIILRITLPATVDPVGCAMISYWSNSGFAER